MHRMIIVLLGPELKAQVEPTAHFKPEQRGYEEDKTAGMRKRQLINFDKLVESRKPQYSYFHTKPQRHEERHLENIKDSLCDLRGFV